MEQQLDVALPRTDVPVPTVNAHPGLAALPDGKWRSGTSDAALFAAATYAAQALLFAAGLVQKRLLGPTATGYWALMTTFSVLFGLTAFGALDGATRQIPFHRGRGDRATAAAVANTGSSFAVLSNAVAGLVVIGVALAFGASWSPEIRYGVILLAVIAPLSELADAHETIMQATKRFNVSSALTVVRAAVAISLQTLAVWLLGFYGMFIGQVAILLAALVAWHHLGLTGFRAPAFRWRIERSRLRELSRFGLPIMLNGQLWALFLVVDNLIVAGFLDVKRLGYYAVACSATTYIMLLPKSMGSALAPRMSERFGKTRDAGSIGHYVSEAQQLLAFMVLPAMVGAAFFLMPVLIRHVLPAFAPAIPVVRIMVAGSFFISLTTLPTKVLLSAGYRWSVASLTLVSLAINAAANLLAVGILHEGLRGAAVAVAVSYFAAFLVMTLVAETRIARARRRARHVAEIVAAFGYTIGALWVIEWLVGPGGGGLVRDGLIGSAKLAMLLLALAPWFVLIEARSKGLSAVSSVLRGAVDRLSPRR